MGCAAEEYLKITKDLEESEIAEAFTSNLFKNFKVTLKAKMNEFADSSEVRFNVVRVAEEPYKNRNKFCLDGLKK